MPDGYSTERGKEAAIMREGRNEAQVMRKLSGERKDECGKMARLFE